MKSNLNEKVMRSLLQQASCAQPCNGLLQQVMAQKARAEQPVVASRSHLYTLFGIAAVAACAVLTLTFQLGGSSAPEQDTSRSLPMHFAAGAMADDVVLRGVVGDYAFIDVNGRQKLYKKGEAVLDGVILSELTGDRIVLKAETEAGKQALGGESATLLMNKEPEISVVDGEETQPVVQGMPGVVAKDGVVEMSGDLKEVREKLQKFLENPDAPAGLEEVDSFVLAKVVAQDRVKDLQEICEKFKDLKKELQLKTDIEISGNTMVVNGAIDDVEKITGNADMQDMIKRINEIESDGKVIGVKRNAIGCEEVVVNGTPEDFEKIDSKIMQLRDTMGRTSAELAISQTADVFRAWSASAGNPYAEEFARILELRDLKKQNGSLTEEQQQAYDKLLDNCGWSTAVILDIANKERRIATLRDKANPTAGEVAELDALQGLVDGKRRELELNIKLRSAKAQQAEENK